MKIELSAEARTDILEVCSYYQKEVGDSIRDDFLLNFDDAINNLKTFPLSGQRYNYKPDRLIKVRYVNLSDFPYIVFYRQKNAKLIQIVRVLHGKRNIGNILVK